MRRCSFVTGVARMQDGVTPQRGEFVHLTLTWPPNPGNNDDVAQKLRENPGRSLVLTVQLPAQGIAWQPDHPKALADSDTWRYVPFATGALGWL